MKKMLIVAAFAAVLPQLAAAQVEKQVEVTKAYVPNCLLYTSDAADE